MSTKNFKFIIILFSVSFILLGAMPAQKTKSSQENISCKIVNKEDLLPTTNEIVEYEVFEGETILVTDVQIANIEKQKQEVIEKRLEEERQAALLAMKTVESSRNLQSSDIDVYTDLSIMNTVTADDINYIIDYWDSLSDEPSPFKGQGQVFIDAAKQSGLDPVYLLAHAGLESGWGTKNMSHNYFGIGAFDSNPSNGHNYGNNDLREGIINGAIWIADNFYNNGQTSLYTMRYNGGTHEYCSSSTWVYDISSIIKTSYSLIR